MERSEQARGIDYQERISAEKDSWVLVDARLNRSQKYAVTARKVKSLLDCSHRSIWKIMEVDNGSDYSALLSSVLNPFFGGLQYEKGVDKLEQVPPKATKMFGELEH